MGLSIAIRRLRLSEWRSIFCLLCLFPSVLCAQQACDRIVALSPSLVEVVAALELNTNLVGVSRYTEYPEAAKKLAEIGGFLDPNIETMLSLKPTIVFGLSEHRDLLTKLSSFGLVTARSDHRSVSGIISSISQIGSLCNRVSIAERLTGSLDTTIARYRERSRGKKKVSALVLVGGKEDAINFSNLYVSGRDGYYADLLRFIGAHNVFSGITSAFAGVSREALIKEDPEVIFHIVTEPKLSAFDRGEILRSWQTLAFLSAVKNKRVFLLTDYVDVMPGPRFPDTLAKMAEALGRGI